MAIEINRKFRTTKPGFSDFNGIDITCPQEGMR